MHVLRLTALRTRQQIGVETQLQDGAAFGFSCELGIHDLVRPIAKRTGTGHADEHVGSTAPDTLQERALNDDLDAGPHRRQCLLNLRGCDAHPFDLDDLHPART